MPSLRDKMNGNKTPESAVKTIKEDKQVDVVELSKKKAGKKMISAYVDEKRYKDFQTINKARGLASNAALNLLIADYVLQYKDLLVEEVPEENVSVEDAPVEE